MSNTRHSIHQFEHMAAMSNKLVHAARILDMPVLATEQVPQGTFAH